MTKQQLEAERQKHLDALADIDRKIAELPKDKRWVITRDLDGKPYGNYTSKLIFINAKDRDLHDEWFLMTMRAMVNKEYGFTLWPNLVFTSGREAERYAELCKRVAEIADRHLV